MATSSSQHFTESYPTIYDNDDVHFSSSESFSLPSWRENCLPGHESFSLDAPGNLDLDILGDDIVEREYESSEDDSAEILERLQDLEQFSQKDETRNAIGNLECYYVHAPSFHSASCDSCYS
jgi:hypothetical protein